MTDQTEDKPIVVEVLERVPQTERHHVYDPAIGFEVRRFGEWGLSKGNAAIGAKIGFGVFEKYYLKDYIEGVNDMQKRLAAKAIDEAMDGNTPILLHLLKTKLGWKETHEIELNGEVRSVVSAKPLTKQEFIERYLPKESDE